MKRFLLALLALLITASLLIPGLTALPAVAGSQAQATSERAMTVLASAARTETTAGGDQVNIDQSLNVRGAYFILDVTGVMTSPAITLTVEMLDPVSGNYETLLTGTGVATTGTTTYLLYPGAANAAGDVAVSTGYPLPPLWRVNVEHLNTDPITYSVSALLME